jgi:hypothetical protein
MTEPPEPFESQSGPPGAPFEPQYYDDSGELDIVEALKDGWSACWLYFGLWLAVGAVGYLVTVFAGATFLGGPLVMPVIVWGYIKFTLNTVDSDAQFQDLFSGFNNYLRNLGQMWVLFLLMFVSALALGILAVPVSLLSSVLGTIILALCVMIGSLLVMPRLFCTPFLLVDRDLTAIDSLKGSWELTQGKTLSVLGLFGALYAGALVSYLPLLFVFPWFFGLGAKIQEYSGDPMAAMTGLGQSFVLVFGAFFATVVLATIMGIISYGALASAYRQLSATRRPVQSAL